MEEATAGQAHGRRLRRRVAICATVGIAAVVAVAFFDPEAPASLIRDSAIVLIFVLPMALASVLARWLVERRIGAPPFVGAWATIMEAKVILAFASLIALPVLGLAVALAWILGESAGLLGRAWLLLLIASGAISVAGNLVANMLSLFAPRSQSS